MNIRWKHVNSYEEAKNFFQEIYLHEWDGKPFYWGKVDGSVFGGTPRNIGNRKRNARYNPGYKHWIEGCLQHGGRLYIGQIEDMGDYSHDQIEAYLIAQFPSTMNRRTKPTSRILPIHQCGDLPLSLSRDNK